MLSIIVPAHNEEENIRESAHGIAGELNKEGIEFEIIFINDNSTDATAGLIDELASRHDNIKAIHRGQPKGFGRAVQEGLKNASGDAVCIVMADLSDDPKDIVRYFRKFEEGFDCVFGSRFSKGSLVRDYPQFKLVVNRIANTFIRLLFWTRANDITNAFKLYRREVIQAVMPLQAQYFNITVELPLKAIVRGYSFSQIPINWYGRESGVSKLGLKEMSRKYLFTVLYVWLEKILLKEEIGEYKK